MYGVIVREGFIVSSEKKSEAYRKIQVTVELEVKEKYIFIVAAKGRCWQTEQHVRPETSKKKT